MESQLRLLNDRCNPVQNEVDREGAGKQNNPQEASHAVKYQGSGETEAEDNNESSALDSQDDCETSEDGEVTNDDNALAVDLGDYSHVEEAET